MELYGSLRNFKCNRWYRILIKTHRTQSKVQIDLLNRYFMCFYFNTNQDRREWGEGVPSDFSQYTHMKGGGIQAADQKY